MHGRDGLRPRPRWGALQISKLDLRGLLLGEGKGGAVVVLEGTRGLNWALAANFVLSP